MPVNKTDIDHFFMLAAKFVVLDVRSPAEFAHAHIPGAYNLPLFDNEERRVVGTAYKQESREKAIKIGLQYFGPKMVKMIEEIEKLTAGSKLKEESKTVIVHCWRGGMRSAGVAWLLDLYGFKVYTLSGGYKSFRQWAHRQFATTYNFRIIGGYTGSGKTGILAEMKRRGKATIDLEALANHKGSSFGSIGMPPQPSQEMFENLLALELHRVSGTEAHAEANNSSVILLPATNHQPSTIWIEDESRRIGNVNIPLDMWEQMRTTPVYFLDIPFEERLNNIIKDYGKGDREKIVNAIIRIKKRLGGLETKAAINYLLEDDLKECFRILLTYYDKYYLKGVQSREKHLVNYIECSHVLAAENASKLLSAKELV